MFYIIFILNLLTFFWLNIGFILGNIQYVLEKNVPSIAFGGCSIYECSIYIKSIWSS